MSAFDFDTQGKKKGTVQQAKSKTAQQVYGLPNEGILSDVARQVGEMGGRFRQAGVDYGVPGVVAQTGREIGRGYNAMVRPVFNAGKQSAAHLGETVSGAARDVSQAVAPVVLGSKGARAVGIVPKVQKAPKKAAVTVGRGLPAAPVGGDFAGPGLPVGMSQVRAPGGQSLGFRYDTHPSEQAEFGKAIYSGTAMGATPGGFRADEARFGLSPTARFGATPSGMAARPLGERVALNTGGIGQARAALGAYERGEIGLDDYTQMHRAGMDLNRAEGRTRSDRLGQERVQASLLGQVQAPMSPDAMKAYADEVYQDALGRATQQGFSGPAALKLANEAVDSVLGSLAATGETQQRTARRAGEALGGLTAGRDRAAAEYALGQQASDAQFARDKDMAVFESMLDRRMGGPSWQEKEYMKGLANIQEGMYLPDPLGGPPLTQEQARQAEMGLRRAYGLQAGAGGGQAKPAASAAVQAAMARGASEHQALAFARKAIEGGRLMDDF